MVADVCRRPRVQGLLEVVIAPYKAVRKGVIVLFIQLPSILRTGRLTIISSALHVPHVRLEE